jgi:hypothetical protein
MFIVFSSLSVLCPFQVNVNYFLKIDQQAYLTKILFKICPAKESTLGGGVLRDTIPNGDWVSEAAMTLPSLKISTFKDPSLDVFLKRQSAVIPFPLY